MGLGIPVTNPKMDVPTEKIEVALPILMDVEVAEVALVVALLALPTIAEGEGCMWPSSRYLLCQ